MAVINRDADGGTELQSMLSEVSAAECRLQASASASAEDGEIALIKLTIAACKADLVEMLGQDLAANGLTDDDLEMLVEFLRSEIQMLTRRVHGLVTSQRVRQQRRHLDHSS